METLRDNNTSFTSHAFIKCRTVPNKLLDISIIICFYIYTLRHIYMNAYEIYGLDEHNYNSI